MTESTASTTLRRRVAGLSLIGFAATGFAMAVVDPDYGTDTPPAELYRTAAAHPDAILAAALLFIVSSVLTVSAAAGLLHLMRGRTRGLGLAHAGVALTVVGAFGHMGYATWQLMLARVSESGDEAAMIAFLDRASIVPSVLLPMLIAIVLGLLLMLGGLVRARAVPAWTLALTAVPLAVEFTPLAESTLAPVVSWGAALVVFGWFGVQVLRLSDAAWTADVIALVPDRHDRAPDMRPARS